MNALNNYLNSYFDYILVAFALILVFAIIKVVLMQVKAIRRNINKNIFPF